MFRKVAVLFFGVCWVAMAYVLFPDTMLERPGHPLTNAELFWLIATIASVIAGVVVSILTWRS